MGRGGGESLYASLIAFEGHLASSIIPRHFTSQQCNSVSRAAEAGRSSLIYIRKISSLYSGSHLATDVVKKGA